MKLVRLSLLSLVALTGALAQQFQFIQSGTLANRPNTCYVNQIYYATDQPVSSNTFQCTSQNTWTLIGGNINPGLDASNITSGVLNIARIPVGTSSGTVAAGNDSRFTLAVNSLQIANNLSDLNNASTARTNLGLGSAATHASTDFQSPLGYTPLNPSNNLSDVSNASTARTNLGLGTAATHASTDFQAALGNGSALQVLREAPNTVSPVLGFTSLPLNNANDYIFTQVPGGTLTAGTPATVTLTPCPLGVVTGDSVYISGGTGTAEPVAITGGTCTSGASTGTVQFTPANSHSGSWLIGSATGGIMEAVCALPTVGGEITINNPITLLQSVGYCGKSNVRVFKNAGQAITSGAGGPFNILGTVSTSSGEERYGSLSQADSDLGQSAYGMIYLNPASQNVPNEYNILSTIYAGDTTLPNALTRVAGYFFAETGMSAIDIWGTNIGVTMETGTPKVNVQGIELDFNNRSSDYSLHDAKTGNGISIINCCPSGAYYTGAAGLVITDTGGSSPGWEEGLHITPGAVKLIGLDIDGSTLTNPVTAAFLQLQNGQPILNLRRLTDSSPTGQAIHLVNAAFSSTIFDLGVTGTVTTYNSEATAGQGLSSVVGTVNRTAQTATITATPINGTFPAGLYRACLYDATSTAGSGNVTASFAWTDSVGVKTVTIPTLTLTSGAMQQQCVAVQLGSSSTINYSTGYTGTGAYNLYITAERLQ